MKTNAKKIQVVPESRRDVEWIGGWVMEQLEENGIHDPATIEYSIHVTYTTQEEHECERT